MSSMYVNFKRIFTLVLMFGAGLTANAQVNMFRGTADRNYTTDYTAKGIFNKPQWIFHTGAPVRSTVSASQTAIFFGSSKGVFYSLNKLSGAVNWQFDAGYAINSSAALHNGNVFFSDNKQTLYNLNAGTGKLNWKLDLGQSKPYDWAFDYYYSSPAIINNQVVIGSKDGNVYNIDEKTGKVNWKFKTEGVVRSSPAVDAGVVYVGNTEGNFYAINLANGKQVWHFLIQGHSFNNEEFKFDRRAIIASPVVKDNKVIVGGRDGFLYAIDKRTGKEIWRVDHEVSWIISSVAIKDSILVTGTSDGRFIQAVNLNTGKELWKHKTGSVVWSSPLIVGDKVYIGSHQGLLYCLDLKTGARFDSFQANGIILSSPVLAGNLMYFGCDDGTLYALKENGATVTPAPNLQKYVYWERSVPTSKYGADTRVKQYLLDNGYGLLDSKKLISLLDNKNGVGASAIVFATNFFPAEITAGGKNCLLRNYLNKGGKIVVLGNNPIHYAMDTSKIVGLNNFLLADTVLNLKYGPDDLRSYKGAQPAFPTMLGNVLGLKGFWVAALSIDPKQVDIILGTDENGLASAWVKKYSAAKGSGFVQIWVDENTTDLSCILRVVDYGF